MRYYESLYIVNPNYEQGKLDEVMKTVSEAMSEYGFKIINHFVWGKKRLAYSIQEHKYGSYVLLHFETESSENLDTFERFMVLQKPVLRNQTVVMDEKPKKQSEKSSLSDEKTVKSSDEAKSKDTVKDELKTEAPEAEKETEAPEAEKETEASEAEKETEEQYDDSEENKEDE